MVLFKSVPSMLVRTLRSGLVGSCSVSSRQQNVVAQSGHDRRHVQALALWKVGAHDKLLPRTLF